MTDRENLVELLESHCAVIGEAKCKAAKEEICSPKDCAGCLADHILANGVTVQQWISIKDRMPTESDGTVLVCFPDMQPYHFREPYPDAKHDMRVRTAVYSQYNDRWYIGDAAGVSDIRPTHWMPLPEPPKED